MPVYGQRSASKPAGAVTITAGANIQNAVNANPNGTVFWLEAGIYRAQMITPKPGNVFVGEEGAILCGAEEITSWSTTTVNGNTVWYCTGQTQQGPVNAPGETDGSPRAHYPETVFFDDIPLRPVASLNNLTTGKFYFDYSADRIYIRDNPSGHKVEAGKVACAFKGYPIEGISGGSNINGVQIKNLIVEKYNCPIQSGAINLGDDCLVENCTVRLNFAIGVCVHEGSTVTGCYIHDNGEMGLGGAGDDITISHNRIASNGYWSGIDVFWEGGGFKFAVGDGFIAEHNWSHDNKGFGMWLDIDNSNSEFAYNLLQDNSGGGICYEISQGPCEIHHNMFIGNGYNSQGDGTPGNPNFGWGGAVQIQNSRNVEVYENKIDMTDAGNGIFMVGQNRGSGAAGFYDIENNYIHDNLIYCAQGDGAGRSGMAADYNEEVWLEADHVWEDNVWYVDLNEDRWWWEDAHDSYASWVAASGETGGSWLAPSNLPSGTFDTSAWTSTQTVLSGAFAAAGAATVAAVGSFESAGSGEPVTWNPSDKTSGCTLSNGNLTFSTSTSQGGRCRATEGKSSGKWMFEVTASSPDSDNWYVGITNAAWNMAADPATGPCAFLFSDGTIWADGDEEVSNMGTTANGNVITVCFDADNKLIWISRNGGNWNGSGTANPATGTGGISFASITGPYFAFAGSDVANDGGTANFGAAAFNRSLPSGFQPYQTAEDDDDVVTGAMDVSGTATAAFSGELTAAAAFTVTVGSGL